MGVGKPAETAASEGSAAETADELTAKLAAEVAAERAGKEAAEVTTDEGADSTAEVTTEVVAEGSAEVTVEVAAAEVAAAGVAAARTGAGEWRERSGFFKRFVRFLGPRGLLLASLLVVGLFLGSFGVTLFVGSQAQNAPQVDSSGGGDSGPQGQVFEETPSDSTGSSSGMGAGTPTGAVDPDQPLLAIVIDDWGYGWQAARDFLAFDRPLTVAVLPHLPLSRSQANEAHARGHQVILHLPMEPLGEGWDLGEGAVTTAMTSDEIDVDVRAALAAVPHISGVNNHMGSKATVDPRVVGDVLSAVKSAGLFFLDSRTNAESVVPEVARELGVPFLENDRFIDPDTDPQRVKERILLAARLAKRRGYAIAIGHVRPETYKGLIESLPELDKEGVRLAYLWEILERVYPERVLQDQDQVQVQDQLNQQLTLDAESSSGLSDEPSVDDLDGFIEEDRLTEEDIGDGFSVIVDDTLGDTLDDANDGLFEDVSGEIIGDIIYDFSLNDVTDDVSDNTTDGVFDDITDDDGIINDFSNDDVIDDSSDDVIQASFHEVMVDDFDDAADEQPVAPPDTPVY